MRLIRRSRHALMLMGTLVGFLGVPSARGAGNELTLSPTQSTLVPLRIPFTEVVTGKIAIKVNGVTDGDVELFPQTTTADKRVETACKLPVKSGTLTLDVDVMEGIDKKAGNTNCVNLLSSTVPAPFAVSLPGSAHYALVVLQPPTAYGGESADIVFTPATKESKVPKWPVALPTAVKGMGYACHVQLGRWYPLPCPGGKLTPPENLQAAIDAALAKSSQVNVVVKVIDASSILDGELRQFVLKAHEEANKPANFVLSDECLWQIGEAAKKGKVPADEFYTICVDARGKGTPELQTWTAYRDSQKAPVRADDFRLTAGLPVVVFAWFPTGMKEPATIDLDGKTGEPPQTYIPPKLVESEPRTSDAGSPRPAPTRNDFGRQLGPKTMLKIDGKGADALSFRHAYEVETLYCGALRLGVGLAWSPLAREIGVRTSTSGVKYATTTDGDGDIPGLVGAELVFGYSLFLTGRMSDLRPTTQLGLSFSLGVLKQGAKGLDGLSSLRVGLEIARGLDFSLALQFGAHRHDTPAEGYRPGQPLPVGTEKIESKFDITPGFGLVLNLTPSFLKAALAFGG